MARRRKKKRPTRPEFGDVVGGRVPVEIGQLFALIRSVNPTDRDLSHRETKKRYAEKSQLTNLLIEQHVDHLLIVRERADTLAIRRRERPEDACHALMSDLSEEARSRIQWILDTAETAETDSSDPPNCGADLSTHEQKTQGDATPGDLMKRGRTALEEYDYEEARSCLTTAFEESRGAVEPAIALLELLVDLLAADEDASQLDARLSDEAAKDPSVRVLMALAAARSADRRAALRWIKGIDEPRTVEVFVALARESLHQESVDQAEDDLASARNPTHPAVIELSEKVAAARAVNRRPFEEALLETVKRGDREKAVLEARHILERWPKSETARRVLKKIKSAQQADAATAALEKAESALINQDFEEAVLSFRAAIGHGANLKEIKPRIAEANKKAADKREAQSVDVVLKGVEENDLAKALQAYLQLEPHLRAQVRNRTDLAPFHWLEEMKATGSSAAQAALALHQADLASEGGDAHRVLDMLSGFENILRHVGLAQELIATSKSNIADLKRQQTKDTLERVRDLFEEQRLEEAHEACASLDFSVLSEEDHEHGRMLRDAINRDWIIQTERRAVERLLKSGSPLAVLSQIARLEGKGAIEEDTWKDLKSEATKQLRTSWHWTLLSTDETFDLSELRFTLIDGLPSRCVLPNEQDVVFVVSRDHWVFVRVVELCTGRSKHAVILKTPKPLFAHDAQVEGASLWVFGRTECALELSTNSWEIVGWHDLALPSSDGVLEQAFVVPGTRLLCLHVDDRSHSRVRFRLFDVDQQRICHTLKSGISASPLDTAQDTRGASIGWNEGVTTWDFRGTTIESIAIPHPMQIRRDPSGSGYVAISGDDNSDEVLLWEINAAGGPRLVHRFEGSCFESVHCFATSSADRTVAVLLLNEENDFELSLFIREEGRLQETHRSILPAEIEFLEDQESNHLWVAAQTDRGLEIRRVGQSPPIFRGNVLGSSIVSDPLGDILWSEVPGIDEKRAKKITEELRKTHPSDRPGWHKAYARANADDPDVLALGVNSSRVLPGYNSSALLVAALEAHPTHKTLLFLSARKRAHEGKWEEVVQLLSRGSIASAPTGHLPLLGAALVHVGRVEEAQKVLMEAEKVLEMEEVKGLIALCNPPENFHDEPGVSRAIDLIHAVQEADAAASRGQWEDAVSDLDIPIVWNAREEQSLGRLAWAYLHIEPPSIAQRFRKLLVLSSYAELHQDSPTKRDIPMPGIDTWDADRLDAVDDQARGWLNRPTWDHD